MKTSPDLEGRPIIRQRAYIGKEVSGAKMDRDKHIKRKLYKKIPEEHKRLEEEKKNLLADIRVLAQCQFSSEKQFVKSKWRKHFEREEAFNKLWKEIQPGKDRGTRST